MDDADADTAQGSTILIAVAISAIITAGILGLFVGELGAEQGEISEIIVLDILTVPLSPVPLAVYAMGATSLIVIVLFGAVSIAARFDSHAER
ncbi:hypothetical protein [Natronocalculus amylovorans]|uniref:Cox cluster protein n=1 Tax=Natronocalculus amylovorans TaxID=2917812 RepID=A0AAE3FY00_9EURY|nr:hypothetical protein [Natronocalculus amylovorans]MCL9816950.1 hypothetical protein [Natronocalculus amylovorans]NUE02988.1 hypothetical protein [Halorubraceae archaeon YAN]